MEISASPRAEMYMLKRLCAILEIIFSHLEPDLTSGSQADGICRDSWDVETGLLVMSLFRSLSLLEIATLHTHDRFWLRSSFPSVFFHWCPPSYVWLASVRWERDLNHSAVSSVSPRSVAGKLSGRLWAAVCLPASFQSSKQTSYLGNGWWRTEIALCCRLPFLGQAYSLGRSSFHRRLIQLRFLLNGLLQKQASRLEAAQTRPVSCLDSSIILLPSAPR